MTSRTQKGPAGPSDTLEDALIRRIAVHHYPQLRERFQAIIRQQLDSGRQGILQEAAIANWQQTLARISNTGGPTDLIEHINTQIIPLLRQKQDLAETLFLILFFKDDLRNVKRAWCPSDDAVLTNLGFPYSIGPVTRGLPGIRGLASWEVEFTEEDRKGLRGNLKHQYRGDLTEDQFKQDTYHPEGDWLVGIKSAVFLGIDIGEPDFTRRVGQICLASPVPNLFGVGDQLEGEPAAAEFFQSYLDCIPNVQETRSFCQSFTDCVTYRETGATQLASAWMIQTVALTHKHRREAMYMDSRASVLDQFFRFAVNDPRLHGLVRDFKEAASIPRLRARDLAAETSFIRDRIKSQRRFYEFLRHFSYQCLRELGAPSSLIDARLQDLADDVAAADSDRMASFQDHRDFRRFVRRLTSAIARVQQRPFQKLEWLPKTTWEPLLNIQEYGAIEYIVYQLLHNAEKNTPRDATVVCSARNYRDESGDSMLEFTLSNLIRLPAQANVSDPICSRCNQVVSSSFEFKEKMLCSKCLNPAIKEFFDKNHWSSPKHTGGFGLFLVQKFVEQFYGGQLSAHVPEQLPLSVSFSLGIPIRALQRREINHAR